MADFGGVDPSALGGPGAIPTPPTADLIETNTDKYQSLEQSGATKIAQDQAQTADKDLQRWNQKSGRITTTPMGKNCDHCPSNFKQMTLDKLKTTGTDQGHSTEFKGSAEPVLGVNQKVTTGVSGDTKSGTYFYLDSNNNWIKVDSKDGMEGKKTEAELAGGAGIKVGGVGIDATVSGKGSASIPGANAGFPR